MAYLLLGAGQIIGLLMIGYGVAGGWLQLAALAGFAWWTSFVLIGEAELVLLFLLMASGELLAALFERPPIDSAAWRRLAVGSLAGGIVGAGLGILAPLLGSMFGAAVCAVAGALLGSGGLREQVPIARRRAGHIAKAATRATTGIVVATFVLLVLT